MAGKKDYHAKAQVFEMLYEDYQEPIERYLVMRVHDQEFARDLCQDTFERFWKFLLSQETTLQQTAYYKNCLYITATNLAIDKKWRKKRYDFVPLPENEVYAQFAELMVEGYEELICEQHYHNEILAAMSPQYRDCLVLHVEYGLTNQVIAVLLGISEKTVSANISRGRANYERLYTRMLSERVPVAVALPYEEWNEQFKPIIKKLLRHLLAYRYANIAEHDVPCATCNHILTEYDELERSSYVVPIYLDGCCRQRMYLHGFALLMERMFPAFLITKRLVSRWKRPVVKCGTFDCHDTNPEGVVEEWRKRVKGEVL